MKRVFLLLGGALALLLGGVDETDAARRIPLWPLFSYESGDDETKLDVFFSCFKWQKKEEPERVRYLWMGTPEMLPVRWPLFMRDEREDVAKMDIVWPVFAWHRRQRPEPPALLRLWVATPLAFMYDRSDPRKAGRQDRALAILTVLQDRWSSASTAQWNRSRGLFPLFWWDHDSEGGRFLCIHPYLLFHERNSQGGHDYSILDPFFFVSQMQREAKRVSLLARIFDYRRHANGDRQFNFVWRVFAYEEDEGKRSIRLLFSPRIPIGHK
jgi:hypothetical protein